MDFSQPEGGEMPGHVKEAPKFRERGSAGEFILEDGKTYLILKFSDGSILVLQKARGMKKALVDYKSVKRQTQKSILRKLGCKEATLYQMGAELFK